MSTSPTKEASPSKTEKSIFTEKEDRVLKVAWLCLKSAPEIDIEKLKVAADFNTTKTAQNTWGVIKKKLATLAPPAIAAEGEDGDSPLAPPLKSKATPKKRGKKATVEDGPDGDDNDDKDETPTKKRKTPKKVKAGKDELLHDEVVKPEDED